MNGILYLGLSVMLTGPLHDAWVPTDVPTAQHYWAKSHVRLEQREGPVVFLKGVYAHPGRDKNAYWGMPLALNSTWWLHTHGAPTSGDKVLETREVVDGQVRYPLAWLEREQKLAVVTGMIKLKLQHLSGLEALRARRDLTIQKVFKRERLVLIDAAPGVPLRELVQALRQHSAIARAELDLLYHFAQAH